VTTKWTTPTTELSLPRFHRPVRRDFLWFVAGTGIAFRVKLGEPRVPGGVPLAAIFDGPSKKRNHDSK
jgi:hypothetical protein